MLLVLIGIILLILVVRTQLFRAGISTLFSPGASEVIDRNTYQAVFLTNGATYFGKLQPQGDDWFVLTEVYYLQTTDQGVPQLVKRGNEAQGPREPMLIAKDQVLFIENMRDDSDIVTLIKRFKSGQGAPATPIPATPVPTSRTATPAASPSR
jgi:hypothetical protein